MAERVCKICGEVFYASAPNQQCCSAECTKENKLRVSRQWWHSKAQKEPAVPAAKASVCDSYCRGCVFKNVTSGDTLMCVYYLVTNIRRPCPAGTGCTVKQVGKSKGRWAYENNNTWERRKEKRVFHRVCPCCGTEFDTTDPRKIFCSRRCNTRVQQRAHVKRIKEAKLHGEA